MAELNNPEEDKLFSSTNFASATFVPGVPARQPSKKKKSSNSYSNMYEGQLTNTFTTINSKKTKHSVKTLDNGGQGWLFDLTEIGGGEVTLSDPDSNTLSITSSQLLDIIALYLTKELPYKAPDEELVNHLDCVLNVDTYMKMRDISSREDAVKQLKKDFKALFNASTVANISYHKKGGKKVSEQLEVRYIDAIPKGQIKDYAHFRIALSFAKYLVHSQIMPYPVKILTASKNKNFYYIGKKLAAHYNMNHGKKNAQSISVEALLEYTPEIPSLEEEYNRGRHYIQKCIVPLERTLEELVDKGVLSEFSWWHKKNKELNDDEFDAIFKYEGYEVTEKNENAYNSLDSEDCFGEDIKKQVFNRDSGKDYFIHFTFAEHPHDNKADEIDYPAQNLIKSGSESRKLGV